MHLSQLAELPGWKWVQLLSEYQGKTNFIRQEYDFNAPRPICLVNIDGAQNMTRDITGSEWKVRQEKNAHDTRHGHQSHAVADLKSNFHFGRTNLFDEENQADKHTNDANEENDRWNEMNISSVDEGSAENTRQKANEQQDTTGDLEVLRN